MTVGNMESAELFDAGKKGRGLRATKELNTGEVVFAEASFSAVVFDRYESAGCTFQTSWTGRRTDHFSLSMSLQIRLTHCRHVVDVSSGFLNLLRAVISFLMTSATRKLSRT